ncbi:hypothetical protein RRG08_061539 [Elysia crispata]|uniref:Uncharacterized protein n=1 Tax=Elysia crispata TaxID=231223 RepID=A0AAE1AQM0_9GAST|nr:hypothetical protein RRG08_061539 [Elysia crispata]
MEKVNKVGRKEKLECESRDVEFISESDSEKSAFRRTKQKVCQNGIRTQPQPSGTTEGCDPTAPNSRVLFTNSFDPKGDEAIGRQRYFNRSFDKSEVLLRRIEYEDVTSSVRQAGGWARRLDSTPDHQLAQAGNRHQLAQAGNRTQNLLIESVAQRSTDFFALAPLLLRKRGTY